MTRQEASPRHSADSKPLTPVVFHTLLALAGGPLHGYAISQEVDRASDGHVRMGPGTLYGSLQRMQSAGLVREAAPVADNQGPHRQRRRYYEITATGQAAVRVEARRLEKVVELARARAVLDGA